MLVQINTFLNCLTSEWLPIKEHANKYIDQNSKICERGIVSIMMQPWIAPQSYGLTLFPPANTGSFKEFERKTGISIPVFYQNLLLKMNGCFVYDFSLFGLPDALYTSGILTRDILQQYDLGIANTEWIRSYNVNNELFYIGGRAYSFEENIGYFVDNSTIISVRENGQIVKSWNSFNDFLNEEITIAEEMMLKEKKGFE